MGPCTTTRYKVPKKYSERVISRIGKDLPDDSEWCGSHQSFFVIKQQTLCICCKEKKPRRDLRSSLAHIPSSRVGEKICTSCISDPVPPTPQKSPVKKKLKKVVADVIDQKYSIIPVETKFYNQIINGEKPHKWFSAKVSKEYLGKIVLMRAKTPDAACRLIIGAVILGQLDPDAKRPKGEFMFCLCLSYVFFFVLMIVCRNACKMEVRLSYSTLHPLLAVSWYFCEDLCRRQSEVGR